MIVWIEKKMIETLIKYKISPKIIDMIANIYTNDVTEIKMGDREEKIEINSGIKQGCTASTVFFKMITYEIMKKLEEEGEEFMVENIKINSSFFADDSIIIARNIEKIRTNLKIIAEVSKTFGLVINEEKSNIMIYRKGKKEREEAK